LGTGWSATPEPGRRAAARQLGSRALCLVLSLTAHSSWAMVCPAARLAPRGGWEAQAVFRLGMAMETVALVPGSRPEPKPPRR